MSSKEISNGKLKYTYVIDMLQIEFSSEKGFERDHLHNIPNKTSVYLCLEGASDMDSSVSREDPILFSSSLAFLLS